MPVSDIDWDNICPPPIQLTVDGPSRSAVRSGRRLSPLPRRGRAWRRFFGQAGGDRWFADSSLEGDGFEPSVPVAREPVYIAEMNWGDRWGQPKKNSAGYQWFESISLRRGVCKLSVPRDDGRRCRFATRKLRKRRPIVLFAAEYWDEVMKFDALVKYGTISPNDLELFHRTNSLDEAYEIITKSLTKNAVIAIIGVGPLLQAIRA
jgi:hypothetical protein